MDARSALLTQLDSLAQQLLHVEKAVQSDKLDGYLRDRVGPRFDTLFSQKRTQLTNLRQQVSSNQPLKTCWSKFHELDQNCRNLFEECLAFIQGALARIEVVDNGMCLLADYLLDDLAAWADAGWRRFTLLSTKELYRETAGLIRIHFPDVSLWGLPIVAHEFGHFLGPELREDRNGRFEYPFQEMLKQADTNRPANWPLPHVKEWHHLHEHFADLFATYTLGPAFASSFILLRLNPLNAYEESHTHPSHSKRIHSILWLLERMNQAAGGFQPYRSWIDILRSLWQQGLQDVEQNTSLSNAEIALLESKLNELYDIMTRTTPTRLAYQLSDWLKSQSIAAGLLSDNWPPNGQNNGGISRRDVLNAAWLSRLELNQPNQYQVNVRDINSRALEMYRAIPPRQL